jgi:hypothetical protein
MPQSRQFILKQTATLLRLGVAPMDVERTIAFVDKHLPDGADAATWVPSEADLNDGLITEAAIVDSRTAFYLKKEVPRRFRKVLDAREVA